MKSQKQDTVVDKNRLYSDDLSNNNRVAHSKPKNAIRIMTFNVHTYMDSSKKEISEFINTLDADVICLQEHHTSAFKVFKWINLDSNILQNAQLKAINYKMLF